MRVAFPSKGLPEGQNGGGSEESAPVLSVPALSMTLFLSQLRAQVIVGVSLAEKFPTDAEWWALTQDEEYVASLNALAEIMNDVVTDSPELTPQEVAKAASNHYARAAESVELISEFLGVASSDLLTVLSDAQ